MRLSRRWQDRLGLLSLWALCLALIAPTVSHGLMAGRAADWVLVCTVDGPKRVVLGPAVPDPSSPASSQLKFDCPMCLLQEHSPVLSNATGTVLPARVEGGGVLVPRPSKPLIASLAWRPQQSRGPPASA